jgi:hypothetical protein
MIASAIAGVLTAAAIWLLIGGHYGLAAISAIFASIPGAIVYAAVSGSRAMYPK